MPFLDEDPWTQQFFKQVKTDSIIPADDMSGYQMGGANFVWVYNKLGLMHKQNLLAFPDPIDPSDDQFPIIKKPITNLYGMGQGVKEIADRKTWDLDPYEPGHFWSKKFIPVADGYHQYSVDMVMGEYSNFWHCTMGAMKKNDVFDSWSIVQDDDNLMDFLTQWSTMHLYGFVGIVNLEVIEDETHGYVIIDCHLRMSSQFIDLYGGKKWLEHIVSLSENGKWIDPDFDRAEDVGHSLILWTETPGIYKPDTRKINKLRKHVSSIQITTSLKEDVSRYPGDGKHYRLAIVNDRDISRAEEVRKSLSSCFGSLYG